MWAWKKSGPALAWAGGQLQSSRDSALCALQAAESWPLGPSQPAPAREPRLLWAQIGFARRIRASRALCSHAAESGGRDAGPGRSWHSQPDPAAPASSPHSQAPTLPSPGHQLSSDHPARKQLRHLFRSAPASCTSCTACSSGRRYSRQLHKDKDPRRDAHLCRTKSLVFPF